MSKPSPFPSTPILPLTLPLFSPIYTPTFPFSLPLEVGPLNLAIGEGLGSAVSSPGGVWGGATSGIEFGVF